MGLNPATDAWLAWFREFMTELTDLGADALEDAFRSGFHAGFEYARQDPDRLERPR